MWLEPDSQANVGLPSTCWTCIVHTVRQQKLFQNKVSVQLKGTKKSRTKSSTEMCLCIWKSRSKLCASAHLVS